MFDFVFQTLDNKCGMNDKNPETDIGLNLKIGKAKEQGH